MSEEMRIGKIFCALSQIVLALVPQWALASENQDELLMGPEYSHSIAFSPDGKHALMGYEYKVMKLWDLSTGKKIHIFKGHTDAVVSVAFSPDGQFILSGSKDNTMKLWSVSSGKTIRSFNGHTDSVVSVVFSMDGHHALSGSADRHMKLWETSSGKEVRSFKRDDMGYIGSVVAFSPDEKHVLMGNTLWDRSTGKKVKTFKSAGLHGSWKDSVKFNPDGKYVWIGETLFEVASGEAVEVLTGAHGSILHSIFAYSPDGSFVVAGGGGNYGVSDLWDTNNFRSSDSTVHRMAYLKPVLGMESSSWPITAIAISPDSRQILIRTLYVANREADTLTLWDLNDMNRPTRSFKAR